MGSLGYSELLVLLLLIFLCLGFWIWMLLDCIRHEPAEGNERMIWVVVISLLGWLGAMIYFFVRRPVRIRQAKSGR